MKPKTRSNLIFIFTTTLMILLGYFCYNLGIVVEKHKSSYVYHGWLEKVSDREKQISDRISDSHVLVDADKLTIFGEFEWSQYQNTNSMLPLLDYGSNGIYLPVNISTPLYIGDVVSYKLEGHNHSIVHRIVDIGWDGEGKYYITKGDNVRYPDPFKVRKDQILRVMVGIIW